MKALSEIQGVYLHREPIDMRKAINGLGEIVQLAQMGDLMGPYLFVFVGKRRYVIKVLYFDHNVLLVVHLIFGHVFDFLYLVGSDFF